jgi:hypothetical protein
MFLIGSGSPLGQIRLGGNKRKFYEGEEVRWGLKAVGVIYVCTCILVGIDGALGIYLKC